MDPLCVHFVALNVIMFVNHFLTPGIRIPTFFKNNSNFNIFVRLRCAVHNLKLKTNVSHETNVYTFEDTHDYTHVEKYVFYVCIKVCVLHDSTRILWDSGNYLISTVAIIHFGCF